MIRLVVLEQTVRELNWLLRESAPSEQGAFCLLREGRGASDIRLLATNLLLPPPDAWERQGTGILRPRAQWISAAISCAVQNRSGLLFVHSHPDPRYPLGLSRIDLESFAALAEHLAPILDGPFAAAVVHPHGWAGVVWSDRKVIPVDRMFRIGRNLQFLSPIQPTTESELDDRQKGALGVVHDRVRHLDVALVGCGGTGSPTAEQIVRMGVERLILIDGQRLDTPSNVRRVFGSRLSDIQSPEPPLKVDVVGQHLDNLQLGVPVLRVGGDVRTERVFRSLLDADAVIVATDNHGSRAIVNELASTYLMPVIDVGVRAGSKDKNLLSGLVAEIRVLTPTTPCLWCRKSIDAQVIRQENLPEEERRKLRNQGYVVGEVGAPEPSVVALTVLGSGLTTCALLALLSEEGEVAPSGYWADGFLGDSHETAPKEPVASCRCRTNVGLGDTSPPPFWDG